MAIRISGLASGLDTESIVQQLVSAYSVKKDKYVKAQTKLSWKQDAWKSLNTKIYSLYGSISSMRYSSAYSLKTTTVSDSTKAKVTASSSAVSGTQSLKVNQMAKAGYLTGGKLASGTTEDSTLASLGYEGAGGSISVSAAGTTTDIAVDGTTTVKDFVAKLNDAGVKATYDATNQRIFVSAKESGEANDFALTGTGIEGSNALYALGLNVSSEATELTYAQWTMYATNTDGEALFQYDSTGKTLQAVGTYSEELTNQYIQACLDKVEEATAKNEEYTNSNTVAQTAVNEATIKLNYAKAYNSIQTEQASWTDAEKNTFNTIANMSKTDSAKKYTVGDDGSLTESTEAGAKTATEIQKELATEKGLITTIPAGTVDETTGEASTKDVTDSTKFNAMVSNVQAVSKYEAVEDNAEVVNAVHADAEAQIESYQSTIDTNNGTIAENNTAIEKNNTIIENYSLIATDESADTLTDRVTYALQKLKLGGQFGIPTATEQSKENEDASRVSGQDSKIELNGATFTSSTNSYSINGLTIEALATTGEGEEISITTATDTQGLYDQVKDFLKQYNELINEMTSLYNADSAKGYDPLTTDEKDGMTDTQIEEWEKKIKDSLFRRDDTLDGVMSVMETAMSSSFEINGKKYSLSSFGISTLGILNASSNQQNAYHIDGDADDTATKTNKDKLMAAIENDPDTLAEFMKQLTTSLYDNLDKKMKSTTLSSAYTVYNDKQMATEYSDYTTTIKKWEQKLSDMEDSYYKKFAAMESALATLQSNSSSLSSLLG